MFLSLSLKKKTKQKQQNACLSKGIVSIGLEHGHISTFVLCTRALLQLLWHQSGNKWDFLPRKVARRSRLWPEGRDEIGVGLGSSRFGRMPFGILASPLMGGFSTAAMRFGTQPTCHPWLALGLVDQLAITWFVSIVLWTRRKWSWAYLSLRW